MHTDGIAAWRKRKKDVYPGQASPVAPNLVRERDPESLTTVVFSDLFEIKLAERTKVRGCFTLWKRTRHILGQALAYHMRAEFVTSALQTLAFDVPAAMSQADPATKAQARLACWARRWPQAVATWEQRCRTDARVVRRLWSG